jgi:hypothetical protein
MYGAVHLIMASQKLTLNVVWFLTLTRSTVFADAGQLKIWQEISGR